MVMDPVGIKCGDHNRPWLEKEAMTEARTPIWPIKELMGQAKGRVD